MPVVSIVKTPRNPDDRQVEAAVRQAVEMVGGLRDLVRPGGLAVVKPNLVAVPDHQRSGACTSPEVCRALANLLREVGARPVIADSAARGVDTEQVIDKMGYGRLRDEGYEVVDLKRTPGVRLDVPAGEVLKEVTTSELVVAVDLIISAPVMKTHDQCEVTLSLKNLKGLEVLDRDKKWMHRVGVNQGVCDLAGLFRPGLAVIDGIWAMEGLGPMYGLPVEMDLIVASRDLVAADAVAGAIMGFAPEEVPTTTIGAERGLGVADLSRIEIVGERLEEVRRRFLRVIEDDRLRMGGFAVVHSPGTCTACRNGLMSSLFDMKNQGILDYAQGLTIITGEGEPPAGVAEDTLVAVGNCCLPRLKRLGRYVRGCPPNNIDIVQGIVGNRLKAASTYATGGREE